MTTRKIYFTKLIIAFTVSLLMTLLLIRSGSAISIQDDTEVEDPYRTEEFTISTPGQLEVKTSGGHINVEGSRTNTVRVEMYVERDGENVSPNDFDLDKWEINISEANNKVQAIAKRKGTSSWFGSDNNVSISFVVVAPKQMTSTLNTSGGHIEIRNLEGDQRISTSGGHLSLADLKGSINAKTSGGHIDLSGIEGDIKAKTSGGHITTESVSGMIDLKTSGGHIKLADINGSVKASTSGGSITANFASIDQYAELKTSGGNIDISIPEGIGVDLSLKGTYVQGSVQNFSGEMEDNKIDGKLNGGGPKVSARTSGGAVRLSFN